VPRFVIGFNPTMQYIPARATGWHSSVGVWVRMKKNKPRELAHDEGNEVPALIASMPASAQERRIAFGVVIFLSVVFAVVIPFAPLQVGRVDVFIPVVQSIICVTELITAVFLFAQYSIQPQRALLALEAAISAAACSRSCKRSNFRVPIVRPVFSAADGAVQRGSLISGA
jgi:hypothetical protein